MILIAGFQLFNLPINTSKALLTAIIVGAATFYVRDLPLLYGVHTIILVVLTTLTAAIFTGNKIWQCCIAVTTGALFLGVLESVLMPVIFWVSSTSLENLVVNPWLNIVYSLPAVVIAFIVYIFSKRHCFMLFDLSISEE